ncbi:hypothetical protein [Burkholderia sp. Tr-862]|uniref:hypothetical protein n=1 Tax=Burkholderia sp. Tr-862 TaxID=2608331 RepID=UPI00141A6388|nr:hypothetical protein [Burkholderia sp. Tr-862]
MGAWIGLMKNRMIRRWPFGRGLSAPASASVSGPFPLLLERVAAQQIHRFFRYKNKKRISRRHAFNALDNNQSTRSRFDESFTSRTDLADSSRIDYSPAADPADFRFSASVAARAGPVASRRRFGTAMPANPFQ